MAKTSVWFMTLLLVGLVKYAAGFKACETTRSFQRSHSKATPYIIQGRETDTAKAPWQIRLQIKPAHAFSEELRTFCGGSIIDSFWIVTAAHCVEDASEIMVILGSTYMDPSLSRDAVTLTADHHVIHPRYGKVKKIVNGVKLHLGNRFDVALVHVPQEIQFKSAIQPITVEDPCWTGHPDEMFKAYGWGQTSGTNTKSISDRLRSVSIPEVSKEYCYEEFHFEIGDEMFCVGAPDRGVCKGDSGGPLVNENKKLVGIVSYGNERCNSYSIFTKLTDRNVYSWIVEKVNSSSNVAGEEEQPPTPATATQQAEEDFYSGSVAREQPETHPSPVADAVKLTLHNNCDYTVWPGTLTGGGGSGGWELGSGRSLHVHRSAGWSGRFWGRTGCNFDWSGNGHCVTGDCNGLRCRGGGAPPATLAVFTLADYGGHDFYGVSLVDGFNIPMSIRHSGGSGSCKEASCKANVNDVCPNDFKVMNGGSLVACKSACLAWGSPEFCCTGSHNTPQTCLPTEYSRIFKRACPHASSYAYDSDSSTHTCTGADYTITFCP